MANSSIAPPPPSSGGKWLVLLLLLLLGGAAAWYFLGRCDPEPAPTPKPTPTTVQREAFEPQLELPDLDAGAADGGAGATDGKPEPPPKRARRDVGCNGTLEASDIRKVISGPARAQIRACYERRLKDNNLLEGSMNLLITIGSNGRVRGVSISGTLGDKRVYSCVRNVARRWEFPKPEGGCVRTSVPFMMTPKR